MLTRLVTTSLILATIVTGEPDSTVGVNPLLKESDREVLQPLSKGRVSTVPDEGNKTADKTLFNGIRPDVYKATLALVKKCKSCILVERGIKVTQKDVDFMDHFLYGSMPTFDSAKLCVEQRTRRHKRNLLNFKKHPLSKWALPILYKYDNSHTADGKLMIEAAIRHWEKETCIKFKHVSDNAVVSEQYLLFTSQSGCFSYVGKLNASFAFPQQININSRACTKWLGLPVHEIGHAIGFWHEHVRPDRDDYLTVKMSSIYNWYLDNFVKLNSSFIDPVNVVPYDFGSIMHYTATDMSTGIGYALEPKNPLYLKTMGQRVGLSFFDSKLANLAYCKDKCVGVKPRIRCYNHGYRDPNDCSRCKCPEGFGRRQCRDPAPANGGCSPTSSGIIKVRSTKEHCLWSRNYHQADGHGTYHHGDKCNWLLKARVGRKIQVRFAGPRFSTFCYYDGPSCYQWVEIKYMKDLALRGPRFCCNSGKIPTFNGKDSLTSESNEMMVIFNAEFPLFINKYATRVPAHYRKGFKLCYRLAPK